MDTLRKLMEITLVPTGENKAKENMKNCGVK